METSNEILQEKSEVLNFNPADTYKMKSCCLATVRELVDNNSLMMCQGCESLIKSFTDEASYHKYLLFCRSRNRLTNETVHKHYKLVIFRRC